MPDLPGIGKVPKGWIIAVGAISVGVLGYAWYKHKQSSASSGTASTGTTPTASTGDPFPPDGTVGDPTDPNSTDPATGLTYGDEQQGSYGFGFGGTGYGGFGGYGGGTGGGTGGGGGGGFTTNGQWAQQAEADLGNIGVDPVALAAALGKYLTGQALTSDQQGLVDQAIALEGYPPVAGPSNYPPNMKTGASGGQVAVPNVVGQETDAGVRAITAAGLKATHPPLKPGRGSTITAESPAAGTQVNAGSTVTLTIKEKK